MQCIIRTFAIAAALALAVDAQNLCPNIPIKSRPDGSDDYWVGSWNYWQNRIGEISIDSNGDVFGNSDFNGAKCEKIDIKKNATSVSAFFYGNMILSMNNRQCYGCMKVEQRTPNVMEFKQSPCNWPSVQEAVERCDTGASGIWTQMYRQNKLPVNCKNTFEGILHFSYENRENRGICKNAENIITACQKPGAPTQKDNIAFEQVFNTCPAIGASFDKAVTWDCLGSWKSNEHQHRVYSIISDRSEQTFERQIRCILTQTNQQLEDNQLRYTMSATPNCNEAQSEYQGPWNFITQPVLNANQKAILEPGCMLPQNFSGTWFTSSQYDSAVTINTTHIRFNTLYTTYKSVDTYFSCQQTRDTRFMMIQVTQGKCEIDYVCFEFLPRQQNIVRFRMGKPYRASDIPDGDGAFRHVCNWAAFTISRTENNRYVYQTLILNPPAPVNCPIGGIYNFTQTGVQEFKYETKIRGVTERPRVDYLCDKVESEFKVCAANPKIINLDVERCASVDHVGRPIGEYDEPDNYLQCVGYWQENQRSYLVTYDTEDPVALFRCWVYERLGWKKIRMSRALRAACGALQTPRSYLASEGASLSLELLENEREFDDCPQRFLDGRDPYLKSTMVYVIGSSTDIHPSTILTFLAALLAVIYHSAPR